MATPTAIVAYLALFTAVGLVFLFANLLVGRLLRPAAPNKEKLEVYECGEPTIGSSFVQFDLRFYVVALLFIIFDVEIAFFFPWATVFGKATQLTAESVPAVAADQFVAARLYELGMTDPSAVALTGKDHAELQQTARKLALTSMADIGVFFAVLMVGFAYVWKRGDLDWVRAVSRQDALPSPRGPPTRAAESSVSILSS